MRHGRRCRLRGEDVEDAVQHAMARAMELYPALPAEVRSDPAALVEQCERHIASYAHRFYYQLARDRRLRDAIATRAVAETQGGPGAAPVDYRVALRLLHSLTPRQRLVASLLLDGWRQSDIARHLCLSRNRIHVITRHVVCLLQAMAERVESGTDVSESLFRWLSHHTLKRDCCAGAARPWTGYTRGF